MSGSSEPESTGPAQSPSLPGSGERPDPERPAITPAQLRATGTWMLARGALGFAFGLATVFWPRQELSGATQLTLSVGTADWVIIAYLGLNALLLIPSAGAVAPPVRTALLGQAVVVIPAIVFLLIADTSAELRAAVCIWALLHGGLELWMYRTVRCLPMASDHLIAAGCHLLLGVIVGFGTDMGALTVFGFTGAAVLIASVLYMLGGYSRRSRARAR